MIVWETSHSPNFPLMVLDLLMNLLLKVSQLCGQAKMHCCYHLCSDTNTVVLRTEAPASTFQSLVWVNTGIEQELAQGARTVTDVGVITTATLH